MVYSRSVNGQARTFEASGLLWRDTLVMKDLETGTLWSQVAGRAIHGPGEGASLRPVPSVVTTWGRWKKAHPDTLVMKKEPLEQSPYERYFASERTLGVSGGLNPDGRLAGKSIVLGVQLNGEAVAYRLQRGDDRAFLNETLGGEPILVLFNGESGAPLVYSRRLSDAVIEGARWLEEYEPGARPVLEDQEGNLWDPSRGEAIAGPSRGERLRPVPAATLYWFVWARFHPDTDLR